MPNSPADRNLLFGILAVQMDFISRDQLIAAMHAWVFAKEKPLGQVLQDQNALSSERHILLEALVKEHLKQHNNDPEKSVYVIDPSSFGFALRTALGWVELDNPWLNGTDYYASLIFTWQISPDAGQTWITPAVANTSSNETFVTLDNPNGWSLDSHSGKPEIPLSVLYAGIWGSVGAINQTELVQYVFSGFQSRTTTRRDGTPMAYYRNWNSQNVTTATLLADADGQCVAWARLFIDTLRAQGGSFSDTGNQSNLMRIDPANPRNAPFMMVKNWTFGPENIAQNAPPRVQAGFTNFNLVGADLQVFGQVNGVWQYTWAEGANANVQAQQIPGQNNAAPKSIFENHEVVQIGTTLYDPSYGVTYAMGPPADPLMNFEAAALSGYARLMVIGGQSVMVFRQPGPGPMSNRLVMSRMT